MNVDNMNRKELLKELSGCMLPGHGPDGNKMSDDELRKFLKTLRKAFKIAFEEEK